MSCNISQKQTREMRSRDLQLQMRRLPPHSFPFLGIVILVASLILLWQGWQELQVNSIGDDAAQNLRSAMNLWQRGVYGESMDPVAPGFRREPFPNWLLATHLKLLFNRHLDIRYEDLINSPILLKQSMAINLLYVMGLFASLWALCVRLIRPAWLAQLVAAIVIYYSYTSFARGELGTLNTELIAAFLLVLSALTLLLLWHHQSQTMAVIAGTVLGCLVLTKATGSYIVLLFLPLLPFLLQVNKRQAMALTLCVSLGFGLTVLPWVARNAMEFSKPGIAKGGGIVLLIRSAYDEMSAHEFWGAFYAYAPERMQKDWFEAHLGFSEAQLQCGGSLERLKRDLPCDMRAIEAGQFGNLRGFYHQGKRTLPTQIRHEADRLGKDSSDESLLQEAALKRIRSAPFKHLLVSLPLSWRGMWSFENQQTWFGVLANGLAMAALLAMPLAGALGRRPEWLLISFMGAGYFLFYGLFTHFISRYSEPLIPLALVCLSVLIVEAFQWLVGEFVRRLSANHTPG
ncbi:MAG: hypothetical protein ACKOPT_14040 [Cyanobium sp.]